jgi:hypothetical protein
VKQGENFMKAQTIPEFLVVYSALLAVFLIVFTVAVSGSLNLYQSQDSVAALRNAYDLATALNYVYLAGDGAGYNFTMTGLESGENITIWSYEVTSKRIGGSAAAPLLDGDTNTTALGSTNVLITNSAGELYAGN